jgi:2-polyprenyl-3-methyl-5-hydroxy-6-metoxy-1,4-benzoquinol methylase
MTKKIICKICSSDKTFFLYRLPFFKVYRCSTCGTGFANKKFTKEDFDRIYAESYYDSWKGTENKLSKDVKNQVKNMKLKTFGNYLNLLKTNSLKKKKLLDVGCATGYLLEKAKQLGYDPYGVEYSHFAAKEAAKRFPKKIFSGSLEQAKYKSSFFDVVTLIDVIEHVEDPQKQMKEVKRILKPNGHIIVVTPNLESLWSKILKSNWTNLKEEHIFYFTPSSLKFLIKKSGFEILYSSVVTKHLTLNYIYSHFKSYPTPILGTISELFKLLPNKVRNIPFPIKTGDYIIMARLITKK